MTASIALPRVLRIGRGCSTELADVLQSVNLHRPLIITDAFLAEQPFLAEIQDGLRNAGITAELFAGAQPDPTTDSIARGAAVLRSGEFDCVIGIGGGSPMDTAKAVALLGSQGGSMRDYKAPAVTDAPTLPLIAIPTTAGSGSECTRFTIITDSATDEKMLCAGLAFLPTIALVDYALTMAMPRRLTADTGVDALVHAVEAYVSRRANPFTDDLALTAMGTLFRNLRAVYEDPTDEDARAAMMLGATQAGIAFSNSSVALVHGMSRPIGGHFHIAHGLSNAMLMPAVTEFSISSAPDRYARCARSMGIASMGVSNETAARQLVEALATLNKDLDVPGPREYGILETEWRRQVPVMAQQAKDSGSPDNNPRVPAVDEIADLYHALWS
ncbi:iron-containing alcohol dehydrogenase [Saccharopolyspora elongata]|uniref:Iron-containing alcohol dehydrogenase n=1 Tax=Saccharopolyspora elongata TaxID=2530387 RepID=A0A4R4Y3K1_9PSEU|nr:iron-containing alcohol dehydrogenase [Saccharopolyspora elongata]TDD38805.1 iron-containing alcohol dehydrogenase [Saccharopolyspora elongata]